MRRMSYSYCAGDIVNEFKKGIIPQIPDLAGYRISSIRNRVVIFI